MVEGCMIAWRSQTVSTFDIFSECALSQPPSLPRKKRKILHDELDTISLVVAGLVAAPSSLSCSSELVPQDRIIPQSLPYNPLRPPTFSLSFPLGCMRSRIVRFCVVAAFHEWRVPSLQQFGQ
ncbi:hypothetical protein L227DRAFT_365261 [Lentinus tigrinus ALCF2SS1-6]|uniref:Uncharacterized protein n=1 Tax=Lentinus tigrinus ALCF2SS1-6 TaxID=1328759 RepID=A0A5C2SJS1_9APHY|nr:hypothetical protein L227DRAFT_365261 [Lentinus tigrinus ALCF2SS1-6]